MKNEISKLFSIIFAIFFVALPPTALRADDGCRGIGGTGRTSLDCGIGGTGNSESKAGIGGTGHSGIGGTGAKAAGIGGTGHSDGGIGGTGIVGVITGFGSIWVNGLEVQYDGNTQLSSNETKASANDLAIGQVVVVEANGNNNELQAKKISMVDAVAGKITALDKTAGKITVLGQTVSITTHTAMQDKTNQQAAPQFNQGDYVKVSGLRLGNGEIVATRIERSNSKPESSLVGPITRVNGNAIEVYGLKINGATGNFSLGQEVVVTGQMVDGEMSAHEIAPAPSSQLYGRTEHINLEGYISGTTPDGQIKVGNLEVVVPDVSINAKERKEGLTPGEHIQIIGHFASEHRVIAERIEFNRDRPDRIDLDSIGSGGHGNADKIERAEHADHVERADHVDRPDQPDRSYNSDSMKQQSEHSHK